MIMWFKLIFSLIFPCLIGYVVLTALMGRQKFCIPATVSISFGLGFGILTQVMLLLGILRVKYSSLSITLILVLLGLIVAAVSWGNGRRQNLTMHKSFLINQDNDHLLRGGSFCGKLVVILSLVAIVYYSLYMAWAAMNIPVYTWDSLASSVYNAKTLSYEKSLESYPHFVRANYPLHMPLILTWISVNLGHWNDQLVKVVFPLFFFAFGCIIHMFLRCYTNRKWALFGVAMLFSSNLLIFHAAIAYRDIMMLFYNLATIIFLLLWRGQKYSGLLGLAALFAGFVTFTKLEGTAYLVIYYLLMGYILFEERKMLMIEKVKSFMLFFIPSISICLFYYIYKMGMRVSTSSHLGFNMTQMFHRMGAVIQAYYWAVALTANWNILWLILILSLLFHYKKIRREADIRILLLALVFFFGMHMTIAVMSDIGAKMIVPVTISRIIIHFFPLSILLIILLNAPVKLESD